MKSPFLQPRFEGARFIEHTLPLEIAKDLAAYETLVIELAKHLYLQDHAERQRVPKGFAADFHLHLERLDDGSARPLLSLVAAGTLALGAGADIYFERARDLISECIAAADGQMPEGFPRELLTHFNQVGRSLREDERMELPRPGSSVAVLTPERRKHLVLKAEQVYEREIELNGTIEEADWEKSTFRLRLSNGNRVVIPMPESFHPQARTFGGRHRHQVTVKGVGAFDPSDHMEKVVAVDSIEIQPDFQLAAKFEELSGMSNGWHNSKGAAPDKAKLGQISARIVGHYPEKLPLPAIVPTPEGNLLFEWNAEGDPSLDISLIDLKAGFHSFHSEAGEIEHVFDFSDPNVWSHFFAFLNQHLKARTA